VHERGADFRRLRVGDRPRVHARPRARAAWRGHRW
jgi:hypothetical protein